MKTNKHLGSSLDNFLDEANLLPEVEELASCKFLALKLAEEIENHGLTISEFARRMKIRDWGLGAGDWKSHRWTRLFPCVSAALRGNVFTVTRMENLSHAKMMRHKE
jgi:hypothetical protein